MKVGRNDPCPCGSGKKYKKCCIDKINPEVSFNNFRNFLFDFWSYKEVKEMSNEEIIEKLQSIGIMFNKEIFLKDIERYYSAEQISENWFNIFNVTAKGRDEDFPFFAAWVLWERLAPENVLSMEQMADLIEEGYQYLNDNKSILACDKWLKVWEGIKYRIRKDFNTLEYLDKAYCGSFDIRYFCQELESELYNAGIDDPKYFEIRIKYCKEFLHYFQNEDEELIHQIRRAIIESLVRLNKLEEAKNECEKLILDFPKNPWSYIAYGDVYCLHKSEIYDAVKARELYQKGLSVATGKEEKEIIKERLKNLGKYNY
jgi:hypothetical protein